MLPPDYKKAMAAYASGFVAGAFAGVVLCFLTGLAIWTLPVVLGLLFGAIAFQRKIKQNGNN